jgi:sugar O-acyltransferase (sialic acid O-acetyltransferase NeuD family)
MKLPIVIVGSGGHACSTLELIEASTEYEVVGYVDDFGEALDGFFGLSYLGSTEDLFSGEIPTNLLAMGFVGKWPLSARRRVFIKLVDMGFKFPKLIHPSVQIANQTSIGEGSQLHPNVVLRKGVSIGIGTLINTAAIIDHGSKIGNFTIVNPRATICGDVEIADDCYVGASSTIIERIKVGGGVFVNAGSVVTRDVMAKCAVRGNPAVVYRTNQ